MKQPTVKSMCKQITAELARRKWSMAELGRQINVSATTAQKICKGEVDPRAYRDQIGFALGIVLPAIPEEPKPTAVTVTLPDPLYQALAKKSKGGFVPKLIVIELARALKVDCKPRKQGRRPGKRI